MQVSDILLHTCCAPCTTYCLKTLRDEGFGVKGFFFNPNIHPYKEYRRRLDTLKEYASKVDFDVEIVDDYGLRSFLKEVAADPDNRCLYCYRVRLEECAKRAEALGIPGFSTTLLISPYQKHDRIAEIADDIAKKHGLEFVYRDFRKGYRESIEISKAMELYRQPYCGCIYSEEERYRKG